MMIDTKVTRHLWRRLQGVFCIYKPVNFNMSSVHHSILVKLLRDLNEEYVPLEEHLIDIKGSTGSRLNVEIKEKLAAHPLAIGDGFEKRDIHMAFANKFANTSSGVCLVGINNGVKLATVIKHSRLIRTYRLCGILGKGTLNFHVNGKLKERSTFSHVRYHHMENVLMTIQASHQRRAMNYLGMDMESQGAYEALAEEGIIRPSSDSDPLAYSLKCINFKPPDFTIEISCINEDEYFLRKLVHNIGLMLKTNAATSEIRCIRYGPFTLDDALLRKHWTLEYIIENIENVTPRAVEIVPKTPSIQTIDDSVQRESES